MFRKLWHRLTGKREDRHDLYAPAEKTIYSYFNGERLVEADPIVLYKRYMDVSTDLDTFLRVARSASKDAAKMHGKACEKIRQIFNVKPPPEEDEADCTGTLDQTALLGLLGHFHRYCGGVKKNMNPPATTSTATSQPTPASSDDGPPTSPSSGSGSTDDACSTEPPTPPPSGPPSPSAG